MTDGQGTVSDAGEAFSVVASEARFDILQSLWELSRGGVDGAGFADLRKQTNIDDSGQFNYHLDRLRPRFVRKTDEGYELTHAGTRVVGAAVSGVYTETDVTVDAREVSNCPECAGVVEARYEGGTACVECRDCGLTVTKVPVPPVLVASADPEELPMLYSRRVVTDIYGLNSGFCMLCGGRMDRSLDRENATEHTPAHLGVGYQCRECGSQSSGILLMAAIGDPTLTSFLHDAGVDLREEPVWELDWFFEATGTVVSEVPLRAEATVELDDRALTLTFDESLDVVASERHQPTTRE